MWQARKWSCWAWYGLLQKRGVSGNIPGMTRRTREKDFERLVDADKPYKKVMALKILLTREPENVLSLAELGKLRSHVGLTNSCRAGACLGPFVRSRCCAEASQAPHDVGRASHPSAQNCSVAARSWLSGGLPKPHDTLISAIFQGPKRQKEGIAKFQERVFISPYADTKDYNKNTPEFEKHQFYLLCVPQRKLKEADLGKKSDHEKVPGLEKASKEEPVTEEEDPEFEALISLCRRISKVTTNEAECMNVGERGAEIEASEENSARSEGLSSDEVDNSKTPPEDLAVDTASDSDYSLSGVEWDHGISTSDNDDDDDSLSDSQVSDCTMILAMVSPNQTVWDENQACRDGHFHRQIGKLWCNTMAKEGLVFVLPSIFVKIVEYVLVVHS
ncbi:hypothetical protein GOP47_0015821 [Adiantum capillus-veneris]|uniref:Uncharacterized protein n=1 Tax=Adiantum capillus-veneris TaxID=13818 RepID=A0A9D4ZDK3_ADICA|nr:hypothetical protein GOP47_0015821 [Adiantum capillus-veneris]